MNEKINSKIKLSNNSSFVILIFGIFKFRNIGRSTFRGSKFWPPPRKSNYSIFYIFFKLQYFEKLLLFEIEQFQKFDVFWNWKILEIFNILENANFSNFPHCKFFEFSKLIFFIFKIKFFWICQIANFSNFPNLKFSELSKLEN